VVTDNTINWDQELLDIIPKVKSTSSNSEFNKIMLEWIIGLGEVKASSQRTKLKNGDIQIKPRYGNLFAANNGLSKELQSKLAFIRDNFSPGTTNLHVQIDSFVGNPLFDQEQPYLNSFPNQQGRLLSLFRYWNIIEYYYPYRHQVKNWDGILQRFIPIMLRCKDNREYTLSVLKLICNIDDAHGDMWGANYTLDSLKGLYITPIQTSFVRDTLVVLQDFYVNKQQNPLLKAGDIIVEINHTAVPELVRNLLPLSAGSTRQGKLVNLCSEYGFLFRTNDSTSVLKIKRDNHQEIVNVRNKLSEYYIKKDFDTLHRRGYRLLSDKIGYIYPAKLQQDNIAQIRSLFKKTKGIIIDLRCYPSVFMPYDYGDWLKSKSSPFCRTTIPSDRLPGAIEFGVTLSNGQQSGDNYNGKIIIIVNAETFSQSEFTAMALRSAPNSLIIGNPTAGADGDLSLFYLAGGIQTGISGIGIYYPNMQPTQQIGVKIDKMIYPTVDGIRQKRDQLLEQAINIISESQ
jgi:hypothetical protein